MQRLRTLRNRLLGATALVLLLAAAPLPAHAASKEIIQLQTQVQQLQDTVQRIQSTLDARFGVLQNLVQQSTDNANQVTAAVNALQQKIALDSDASSGKLDTVSGQVQSLNDSVDEVKSRIAKLDKSIQDLEAQLQGAQNPSAAEGAAPATAPEASGAPAEKAPRSSARSRKQNPAPAASVAPAEIAPSAPALPTSQPGAQTPPLKETFQAAVRDYNAARYEVAAGEFQDVLHYYPLDEMAGSAQFYLGEIAYRQKNFAGAVKAYNAVLEGFPGNPKAPAAQLRKSLALLQLDKKEAAITELRLLIRRHPQTPEAAQARVKLGALGVKPAAH
jgi:TolA-binding protein